MLQDVARAVNPVPFQDNDAANVEAAGETTLRLNVWKNLREGTENGKGRGRKGEAGREIAKVQVTMDPTAVLPLRKSMQQPRPGWIGSPSSLQVAPRTPKRLKLGVGGQHCNSGHKHGLISCQIRGFVRLSRSTGKTSLTAISNLSTKMAEGRVQSKVNGWGGHVPKNSRSSIPYEGDTNRIHPVQHCLRAFLVPPGLCHGFELLNLLREHCSVSCG